MAIQVRLPFPPSVNKAYASTRGGRRVLSKEGRLYKQAVREVIGKAYGLKPHILGDVDKLHLSITLHTRCINKGWSTGNAKSRYKRVDVSNRVKLLEDALFESIDLDDSHVFCLNICKTHSESEEYADVHLCALLDKDDQ